MKKSTKLILIEGGLHNIYKETYRILDELFDLIIITSDIHHIGGIKTTVLTSRWFIIPSFRHYKGLWKTLKKENPDIISVRAYYRPYAIAALTYAISHKKKFIVMEEQRNDPPQFLHRILFNFLLFFIRPVINRKAATIVCITQHAYAYLSKKGFKHITYIPVPFSSVILSPEIKSSDDEKLKILCVARFETYKGHEIFIHALLHLLTVLKFPPEKLEVTFVGEGSLKKHIQHIVASKNLEHIVRFLEPIPNEKLGEIYKAHNLFVLPSLYEPVGAVLLEAMTNGLAVIASSQVGATDAIHEGVNGSTFKSGDYKDLAQKIALYKDPKKRKDAGRASEKILHTERNPGIIKELYKKILMPGSESLI